MRHPAHLIGRKTPANAGLAQGGGSNAAVFMYVGGECLVFILQNLTICVSICNMNNFFTDYKAYTGRVKASELANWLLSRGVSSVTTSDIAALLDVPKNHVPQRLAPLKKRNEIVLLANGLWAPVPPEYLTWGAPPAIDIIDAIARYLRVDYYIGWLSAAELHGASHHAPQVFQVAVSRALRVKNIGRSEIQFYHRDHLHLAASVMVELKNGAVPISSKESTLLDIASDIGFVGGIDNAANLIIELCDTSAPDINAICALSEHYPASAVRRLGFITERFTDISELELLKAISNRRNSGISLLDPQSDNTGSVDKTWRLKINREASPDV